MTIVAGFKCSDGIVLCADSEETISNEFKLSRAKLFTFSGPDGESPKYAITFGGAGESAYIDMTVGKIMEKVRASDLALATIRRLIEETILEVHDTHIRLDQGQTKPSISMLIGIWTANGGMLLIKTSSTAVVDVPQHDSIGFGGGLSDYLIDTLSRPGMPSQDAVFLGTHVLKQTKLYAPYCGGESQIEVLRQDGTMFHLETSDVLYGELHWESLDENIRKIRYSLHDLSVSDDQVKEHVESLGELVELARTFQRRRDEIKDALLADNKNKKLWLFNLMWDAMTVVMMKHINTRDLRPALQNVSDVSDITQSTSQKSEPET